MSLYCPYCLTQQAFNRPVCGNCNRGDLGNYIEYARKNPPVWLVTFGFPGHGKTSAINAQSIYIEHIDKIADGTFYSYLDENTWQAVDSIRLLNEKVAVDIKPTAHSEDPLLVGLDGFPKGQTNTIVIYDLAGQSAIDPNENYVKVIQNAKTAWFIVSLNDMKGAASRGDEQPRTINGLFMSYQNAMRKLNASLRGRTILVNYTKADLFLQPNSLIELPKTIQDYFIDDPYCELPYILSSQLPEFDETQYMQQLQEISDALRDFTRNYVPGGRAFIDQAEKRYEMNVEFCITSATGGATGDAQIVRYRVLDPLLWAINLNKAIDDNTINAVLIISPKFYEREYPTHLYNALNAYGANVTTYHVGEKRPVFESGQVPSHQASQAQIPIIGPILDTLDASKNVRRSFGIALLNDQTPFDLYDFLRTHWESDLHVITTNPETASGWSNRSVLGSQEVDLSFLVSGLLEKYRQTVSK